MVVAAYNGTKVGAFWIYADTKEGTPVVRVRHTINEEGHYYEETLSQEDAFTMGLHLLRDYSLNEFGVG